METKTYPNDSIHNSEQGPQDGLTKREYFAGLAMQGLLTRVPKRHGDETDLGILEAKRIAAESRIMADLLIEELNEGGNNE
jgi:Mn-dependent DtxR family transcriptional regulator